ncbi:hypothetical protein [Pseudonocardia sp. GCM10023141]|uniref:hypothetical protein n=1 Tax=Pseudonocardia sp. GCM10023141 TaxID=3252653 RepID=UPI0036176397
MKRYGPLLTLLVVAVLGGLLFVVNRAGDPANNPAPAAAAAAPAAATTTAPPPAAAATPTKPPAAAVQRVYAGRSSGNEVTVAIAIKDGRAVAYVCDGKKVEAWLEGTVSGETLSLTGPNGATITGSASAANSLGTIAVGGKQWPYAAKTVDTPAGLYQGRADVKGVANRIGWIVLPDGTQTGIRYAGGERSPAPVLDPARPAAVTIDGVPVTVETLDGDSQVVAK